MPVGGVNRRIEKMYAVNSGETHKIKQGYVSVGGVWRPCYRSAYSWSVYNSVGTTTWNKYNTVESTTYYWDRFGLKTEYGEWMLEFKEWINEAVAIGYPHSVTLFDKITITPEYWYQTYGNVTIADDATMERISSGWENYETIIGKTIIDGEVVEVKGRVWGGWDYTWGEDREKYYTSYFEDNETFDVIENRYYEEVDGETGQRFYGKRFYKYALRDENQVKDESKTYSEASADSRKAYPDDGASGSYWYVYDRSELSYGKGGTLQGTVTSGNSTTYPKNGRYSADGLWYVRQGTTYAKGSTSYGVVESEDENAYPENGRHTDGRWYVRNP